MSSEQPKGVVEKENDKNRGLYLRSFASERGITTLHDVGSIRNGYIKNREGTYELHSNGVGRRFSALSCTEGLVLWIQEGRDLTEYTIEIKSIIGELVAAYVFQREEIQNLLEKNIYHASRDHSLEVFKAELQSTKPAELVSQFRRLKTTKSENSYDLHMLRLVENKLSNLLNNLIEESFLGDGKIGRRIYIKIVDQIFKSKKISPALYWMIKACVLSGFTFTPRVKEQLMNELEIDKKIPPYDPFYREWTEKTAIIATWIIDELEKQALKNIAPPEKPKILNLFAK
jgi:hypothetical protein